MMSKETSVAVNDLTSKGEKCSRESNTLEELVIQLNKIKLKPRGWDTTDQSKSSPHRIQTAGTLFCPITQYVANLNPKTETFSAADDLITPDPYEHCGEPFGPDIWSTYWSEPFQQTARTRSPPNPLVPVQNSGKTDPQLKAFGLTSIVSATSNDYFRTSGHPDVVSKSPLFQGSTTYYSGSMTQPNIHTLEPPAKTNSNDTYLASAEGFESLILQCAVDLMSSSGLPEDNAHDEHSSWRYQADPAPATEGARTADSKAMSNIFGDDQESRHQFGITDVFDTVLSSTSSSPSSPSTTNTKQTRKISDADIETSMTTHHTRKSTRNKNLRRLKTELLFDDSCMSDTEFLKAQQRYSYATRDAIQQELFRLMRSLKCFMNEPSETKRLLSQLAGILNAILCKQTARSWEIRTWRDPQTQKGLLDAAIKSSNQYAVKMLLTTGICGIMVPQFLPNEPSALESPELLARCALDATGPSKSCPLTDCNQIIGTGYETLTGKQRILRLVLDSVLEVAQPEHRGQILNFRKSATDPDSPTILHRLINAHGVRDDLTWSIDQLLKAGADPLAKANVQLEDCRPERKVKLSPIQLAACSFDCRRLLSVFLSNLNMKQLDVIAELKEQFHYGNNLISVSDKLRAF